MSITRWFIAAAIALSPIAADAKKAPHPAPAAAAPTPITAPKDEPRVEATITLGGFPNGLAVFERGGVLWLVANGEDATALPKISGSNHKDFDSLERVTVPGATVFRLTFKSAVVPTVSHAGNVWQVALAAKAEHAPPIADSAISDETGRTALAIAIPGPGKPVSLTDVETGDALTVVPTGAGTGYGAARRFAEFELLPAAQGVVVRALADGLTVTADTDGISIGTQRGLKLADPPDRVIASVPVATEAPVEMIKANGRVLLDWQAWHLPTPKPEDLRRDLERRAALAAESARAPLLIDLARLMLATGKWPETLGYIDLALTLDSGLDARDDIRTLRGAALALAGRGAQAESDLSRPGITETGDGLLWRGLDAAHDGKWRDAMVDFHAGLERLATYPDPTYRPLAVAATEAAIRGGNVAMAKLLVQQIRDRKAVAAVVGDALGYFDGRIAQAEGNSDGALAAWKPVTEGHEQYYRTRAEMAYVAAALKAKKMEPNEVIARLDRLRFAWRGDAFENEVLEALGQTASDANDYETAHTAFRVAAKLAGTGPVADLAHTRLVAMFHTLFIDGAADAMPPLRARALYNSMRDLAPTGPDGDKALDRLAERMVQMDLLSQAADVVEGQAEHQPDAVVKAQLGARAAALRLLDGKPELALRVLDASEADSLAADLKTNRRLLRTRALSKAGRIDDALQILGNDSTPAADALRVDIGWAAQRWRIAADALGRLIGPIGSGGHLDDAKADLVVRRAVALNLLPDAAGLATLRRDFAPVLEGTKSAAKFEVLTRPAGDGNLANISIIRSEIAEVDMFKDFLAAYRGTPGGA